MGKEKGAYERRTNGILITMQIRNAKSSEIHLKEFDFRSSMSIILEAVTLSIDFSELLFVSISSLV